MILQQFLDENIGGYILFASILVIIFVVALIQLNLGIKMQLVPRRKARRMILISTLAGITVQVILFIFQLDLIVDENGNFLAAGAGIYFENILINALISLIITFITGLVSKFIAYKGISYQEIRKMSAIEKGSSILKVENLKVYYPLFAGILKREVAAVRAVDGISFEIKGGETVGLVGESGCGKTTAAKAILGLVDIKEGKIQFRNQPIPPGYSKYLRQKIQVVFQDPDSSLNPKKKIVDIIGEPLKCLMGITKKDEIRVRVLELLEQVSMKREHMDRFPHEFSGGQKQRITIARALACNPELIILDEPTSALDVSVQAQILNLLKDLQKQYGYGFLFITHNLAVVNHIADRIAVMYLGRFIEVGLTDQIFFNPTHPYTMALLESRSEIDPKNKEIKFVIKGEIPSPIFPPPGCHFNPRCPSEARSQECFSRFPEKIEIEEGHYIWCHHSG